MANDLSRAARHRIPEAAALEAALAGIRVVDLTQFESGHVLYRKRSPGSAPTSSRLSLIGRGEQGAAPAHDKAGDSRVLHAAAQRQQAQRYLQPQERGGRKAPHASDRGIRTYSSRTSRPAPDRSPRLRLRRP